MKEFLRPVRKLDLELKRLRRWYFATLQSYDYTAREIRNYYRDNQIPRTPVYYDFSSREVCEHPVETAFFIIQHDKRDLINKYEKLGYRKYLDQLVLIQSVSLIEIFLRDVLLNCFYEKKEIFYRSTPVTFTVKDFLEKSKARLEQEYIENLIDNHKRSGFKQLVKVYKDYLNISISEFKYEEVFMGKDFIFTYEDLLKMHEMRHLIIHNLGVTDSDFNKTYNYDKKTLSLDEEELIYYLKLCLNFHDFIKEKLEKFYGEIHVDVLEVDNRN